MSETDQNERKAYILKHFHYDRKKGILIRDDRKNSMGSLDKDGYLILKIKGKQYKYHRIVWLVCNGDFPKGEIDHIDRNKLNNHIENLRETDRILNVLNRDIAPNKDTGVEGICFDRTKGLRKHYTFTMKINGHRKTFRFATLFEAKHAKLQMRWLMYHSEMQRLEAQK